MRRAAAALATAWVLATAQGASAAATSVDDLRADARRIEAQAAVVKKGADIDALRVQALAVQADGDALAERSGAEAAAAAGRLAQLGAAERSDPPALPAERRRLVAAQKAATARQKEARLAAAQAGDTADALADRRRDAFNARLFQRGASPLSPDFWVDVEANLPRDLARLRGLALQATTTARRAAEPRALLILAGALVAAALLAGPLRLAVRALGRRRAREEAPSADLRRSAVAVSAVVIDTAGAGLAALTLRAGAAWADVLSPAAGRLLDGLVIAVWWAAFTAALGRTLLSADRPGWRMLPVSDRAAARTRPYPWALALLTAAGFMLEQLNRVAGASLPATVAADSALALVYAAASGACLVALGRGRTPPEDEADARAAARSSAWSLVALAVSLACATAVAAVFGGWSAFAYFVMRQVFWIAVLCGAAFLLLRLADDLCQALFRPRGRFGRALTQVFGLRLATLDQLAVLSSAALRVAVGLLVLSLILAPFGQGGAALLGRFAGLGRGFRIGSVLISPAALFGGVAALMIGVSAVRAFQRWLDTRYLPVTGWDAGVANSISTAVGYLGTAAAVLWALASAGLGLERIALIASALSVGIGFGLQQVVQNFVSGLILLVERPVKVGDWVSVGGVEGDVRTIRVRATEIQTFDRSTLLVPNSELVTKTLQNKTLHGPLGRMTIDLAIASPDDADRARDAIKAACAATEGVLADPEPKVFIDAVTQGSVALRCFCYAAGPRDAYAVRSAIYFDLLRRLRDARIGLAGAQQTLVLEPGPGLDRLFSPPPRAEKPEASGPSAEGRPPA